MNKLYEIRVTHYAPKDMHTATQEYVVAKDDREVFEYLAKGYAYWEEMITDWESFGYESEEEAMAEYEEIYNCKSDDRDVEDLFYGVTQYSWQEVELIDSYTKDLMIKNGLARLIK